jgi:hypothetical protein
MNPTTDTTHRWPSSAQPALSVVLCSMSLSRGAPPSGLGAPRPPTGYVAPDLEQVVADLRDESYMPHFRG